MRFEEFESTLHVKRHLPPVFARFFLELKPTPAFAVENPPPFGLLCPVIGELHDTSEGE